MDDYVKLVRCFVNRHTGGDLNASHPPFTSPEGPGSEGGIVLREKTFDAAGGT
jgi:hypothetical protein